ncbi:endonuclease/exonuclease/phosphatase family protein [Neotabrizicola sp. sgz301269]|uniref:endonuclease/exonuclease/phosphatase family protein n=1 Tax=Neotabrizicola sp. sgz301269 TaxID=3276282 RepID=UPI00376FC693
MKLAIWNVELSRAGPGLLARDIASGKDAQVLAVLHVLATLDADILLLTGVDYDRELIAAELLSDRLAVLGADSPHRFALRPNTGWQVGLDLDGDGQLGGPGDAQGWGQFSGQGGMLLLSRLPIDPGVTDHSAFLWRDLPGALLPPAMSAEAKAVQRLSSTGHWQVPVLLSDGKILTLLAWHATPPVFDGPEDRNGRRNHDETAFWLALLERRLPGLAPPEGPFVLLGTANLDPEDGEGRRDAVDALLASPQLQDPAPRAPFAPPPDRGQKGDAALDTAVFPQTGGLRVELLLPSAGVTVLSSGVMRAPQGTPEAAALSAASRHFPVWAVIDPAG